MMDGKVRGAVALALLGRPVEATNRRGRAITCRASGRPLVGGDDDTVRGVIMVTEEWPRTNGP
jgi:hypothetical protein